APSCSFFLSCVWLPRVPPLFPYTTLFRSFRVVYLGVADPRTVEATVLGWLPYFDEVVLAHPFINPLRIKPEFSPTKSPSQHKAQDRKSTRLNSSHVKISYAVFCLKKKKPH